MSAAGTASQSFVQYLRKVTLVCQGMADGIDLSALHIKFNTVQQCIETPSNCSIRVYNVSDNTAQLVQDEFSQVILSAGYEGADQAQIFKGNLVQVRRGRESPVDTYLDLTAVADDDASWAIVNSTLGRGSTFDQRIELIRQSMGLKAGFKPSDMPAGSMPRGRTFLGMGKDMMRDIAMATDTNWMVQDGALVMVRQNGYLPDEAVELNAATGLIGFPEQTQEGITVKCLLNPKLKVNGRIRLNNKDITAESIQLGWTASQQQNLFIPLLDTSISKSDDGLYRILTLEHSGDTRGNEFYSDMVCWAVSQGSDIPQADVTKGYS